MLRVIIEMVPFGVEEDKRVLEEIVIINRGARNNIALYEIKCQNKGSVWVDGFDRDRGYRELVKEALLKIVAQK